MFVAREGGGSVLEAVGVVAYHDGEYKSGARLGDHSNDRMCTGHIYVPSV